MRAPAKMSGRRSALAVLPGVHLPLKLLDHLIDAEARWPLARRIVFEGRKERAYDCRGRNKDAGSIRHQPVVVGVRRDVSAFVRIGAQVVELGDAKGRERFGPDAQSAGCPLLLEHDLPVLIAQGDDIAVIVEVDELLASA